MRERQAEAIVPVSIADARGKAFGATMAEALGDPIFRKLLIERIDDVEDALLPFLIREFSIEEFVEPGMQPATIRRLLKGSYQLHARKGFIDGVRAGLGMLGVRVAKWRQWFQTTPEGAPGTHVVTLVVDEVVFEAEGQALTQRLQRAITRMIDGTKRYSQDIAPRFGSASEAPAFAGVLTRQHLRVSPTVDPITKLVGVASVHLGCAVVTRITVRPGV